MNEAQRYLLLANPGGSSGGAGFRPLEGQCYVKHGIVYDQTGPRRVMLASDFCFQRVLADDPAEASRTRDALVRARRHGLRICHVGPTEDEANYGGYWAGRVTLPAQAKETLIPTLRFLKAADLKAHLFGSYNFGGGPDRNDWPAERAHLEWMATTIRTEGLASTVFLYELMNEWNLTSPYGGGWQPDQQIFGSDETYAHAAEAISIIRRELGCLCTMGSPGEEDDSISATVTRASSDVAACDFGRGLSRDLMMKHAHRAYYDGRYHGKYKGAAIHWTEPAGPDSVLPPHDSYEPMNDPVDLFGYHAIMANTGQSVSYFNGPGVRHHQPIDSTPCFYEHPTLFASIFPEDMGLWEGPTWFLNPADRSQFIIVVAEEWGLLERPPRPVKTWTATFYDGHTIEGSGRIALEPGYKAVAVRGTFA